MAAGLVVYRGSLFPSLSDVVMEFDSNVTLAQNDLVNVQNGQLEIVDAGETVAGHVVQATAVSSSSTNVPVCIAPFATYIMDSDETGDNLAQDLVGELFDTAGGTGAQIIDISQTQVPENPAVSATMQLLKQNDGSHWDASVFRSDFASDTSIGLYLVAEPQFGQRMGA